MKRFLIITILKTSVLLSACSTTASLNPQTTDPVLLAKWFNGEDVQHINSHRTKEGQTILAENHVQQIKE